VSTLLQSQPPVRRIVAVADEPPPRASWAARLACTAFAPFRFLGRIVLTLYVIELLIVVSLLPLSVLLLLFPAAVPDESVISDTVARTGFVHGLLRRQFNLLAAAAAFIALVVFACEVVVRAGLSGGSLAWGWAVLIVYTLDLAILLLIGRVPLAYNVRNLFVRWKISALTALSFMAVIGLLTVLLAFVNGMYVLTADSGQPGNVLVLADGATDEVFSNLGYDDVALIERETATLDDQDRPLPRLVRVKRIALDGREQPAASRETYCIVNRPVENDPGRRQFVQVRGVKDPQMAGFVHGLTLQTGDWFSGAGVRTPPGHQPGTDKDQFEAVLGAGVARELGKNRGKDALAVGDSFELGDREWVVVGVMNSDGTSFGSEVWGKHDLVSKKFNKNGYSSLLVRVEDDGNREDAAARARAFAAHLKNRFSNPKVNAQTETEYYAKLSENNRIFLYGTMIVAVVMALGGVFGVMNSMFAAVAQRIKDIGVMRILGFKRWQILVSFMLESLVIAMTGGLLGLLIGSVSNGWTATSVISSGQGGGGKTVILRLVVDSSVLLAGGLFTLVMGRLGGLIPALSATRLKILETLR
jgi:ABC-type lipoprotein release transport system permease subunit